MSTLSASLTVVALVVIGLASSYWHVRRAVGEESARDRLIREAHERADAAAHLDPSTIARSAGPTDPHWAAGMARLHNAVRDQHGSEEQ